MKRWLLALPLSILCVFALFSVMAALVNPAAAPKKAPTILALDVLVSEPDETVALRARTEPPKPEPERVTPMLPLSVPEAVMPAAQIATVLPAISLDLSVQGFSVTVPAVEMAAAPAQPATALVPASSQQSAVPLVRAEAVYPPKALRRGIEGYVILQFTIDEQGSPEAISVIDASPKRVFEREAVQAIKRWKYAPKLVDGKAVSQPGQTVKLEFNLAK